MVADLAGPAYNLELTSAVPSIGSVRITTFFPVNYTFLSKLSFAGQFQPVQSVKRKPANILFFVA